MNSRKYIQPYKKIKTENEELKRKIKEIKELVYVGLFLKSDQEKKDTFVKIFAIISDSALLDSILNGDKTTKIPF
jgi:hypothetical protein